jgi:hypothetical protein
MPGTEGELFGVSCPDATDCTTVGVNLSNNEPFYVVETSGVWGAPVDVVPSVNYHG